MFIKHKNNRDVCFRVRAYMPDSGDIRITGKWVNITSATPFVIAPYDPDWVHVIKGFNLPEWLVAKNAEKLDDLIDVQWEPLEL